MPEERHLPVADAGRACAEAPSRLACLSFDRLSLFPPILPIPDWQRGRLSSWYRARCKKETPTKRGWIAPDVYSDAENESPTEGDLVKDAQGFWAAIYCTICQKHQHCASFKPKRKTPTAAMKDWHKGTGMTEKEKEVPNARPELLRWAKELLLACTSDKTVTLARKNRQYDLDAAEEEPLLAAKRLHDLLPRLPLTPVTRRVRSTGN